MAQKIELAKFNFNTDEVVKSAALLKKEILALKEEQKRLKESGNEGTALFVENEKSLKSLSGEYREHIKLLSETQKAKAKQAVRTESLAVALGQEARSIKEARDQNKLLNDLRNTANLKTEEGRKELERLNQKLDENNEFIKENADAYLKQKINIGNYKDSIIEAYREMEKEKEELEANKRELIAVRDAADEGSKEWNIYNTQINQTNTQINILVQNMQEAEGATGDMSGASTILSGNLQGMAQASKEAGGAKAFFANAIRSASVALKGMIKTSLAFLATPIGLAVAAIGVAFLLIKNAMNRSEESTNKLKKAFSGLKGIVDFLLKALAPLGDLLIDGIVKGFELLEKAVMGAMDFIQSALIGLEGALRKIGFDDLADKVGGAGKAFAKFNKGMKDSIETSKELADAEARLREEQRKGELIQKQYMKRAEELRQIRDDESRTMEERIQANRELGQVLEQQLQDELAIAQTALEVANLRIQAEGESEQALDAQAEALTKIADIEERITGQRSEQLVNENSLRRDAETKRQEMIDKRIEQMQAEMDLFREQQGFRSKTLEAELEMERQMAEKKKAILQEELDAKKISQTEYATAIAAIKNGLAQTEAEIAVKNAETELEIFRANLNRKREEQAFLSAERAETLQMQNDLEMEKQLEFAQLRLEQGLINQDEFDKAVRELKEENRIANKEIDEEREEVAKEEQAELRALEFEQELIVMQEEGATKFEVERAQDEEQKAIEVQQVEQDRQDGLISEELYQARLDSIDDKFAQKEVNRQEILAQQKIDITQGMIGAVANVVDKNSKAGKALAIAQALMNTYEGISAGVALGFPQAIPAVAFAAGTGFKAVKDIVKTEVPSADGGGNVGGGSAQGAVSDTTSATMASEFSQQTGQNVNLSELASSGNTAVQQTIERESDQLNMSEDIANAVRDGAREGSSEGAQQGITDLSGNREVQSQSSF